MSKVCHAGGSLTQNRIYVGDIAATTGGLTARVAHNCSANPSRERRIPIGGPRPAGATRRVMAEAPRRGPAVSAAVQTKLHQKHNSQG